MAQLAYPSWEPPASPALAGERAGGQSAFWGAELLGGLFERVAGWLDSLAGVRKLGPEMDPEGVR